MQSKTSKAAAIIPICSVMIGGLGTAFFRQCRRLDASPWEWGERLNLPDYVLALADGCDLRQDVFLRESARLRSLGRI